MDKELQMKQQVRKEQLILIYNSLLSSQIGMLVAGCLLIIMLKELIDKEILIIWFCFLLTSISYKLIIHKIFYSQLNKNNLTAVAARAKFLLGVFISSLVWGSASIFLYPFESETHQAYYGLMILGIVAASIGTLSPDRLALTIFMPITLLPLIGSALYGNNIFVLPFTVMIILFFAVLYITGKKFNKNIIENIELRYKSGKMTKKLKLREQKYRVLFEHSEDPMLLVSNNKIVMANHAAANLFGYSSLEQLSNTSPFNLAPFKQPDGSSSIDKSIEHTQLVKERGYARFEWIYKRLDATLHPADITMTMVPFEGNKAIYCIIRDISEIKEIEHELIKSKQKSESENQSKSHFLANMSHEIRTPMNGVIGTTKLLLQNELTKEQFIRATTIQNSAESMLSILNSILDFSKIEAGKVDLELKDFELVNFLQEFSSTIFNRIKEKKLSYVSPDHGKPNLWFKGDSGRIGQILMNLIDNAIKFTQSGTISLSYSIIEINKKTSKIKFDITDTGIGLTKEKQSTLFDRFTQADSSTTRKFGGTGLGLSICKELVKLMDGDIGFNSKENDGSTFWFYVKLEKIKTRNITKSIKPINTDNLQKFKSKVLVVDDNITNLEVAKGMLKLFNLTVDLAENGQEAINIIREKDYDLVFMDCQMPKIDGYETTKEIRKDPTIKNNSIPIIAITANALKGDREKCLASGMNDYLTKPIDLEQLQKILKQWIPSFQHVNNMSLFNKKEKPLQIAQQTKNSDLDGFFNYRTILERLSGNGKLIHTIAENFLLDIEKDIGNLIGFIESNSTEEIIMTAHKIKGVTATFGCTNLSNLMFKIEKSGKNNSLFKINDLVNLINECTSITSIAIDKKINPS